MTQFRCSQNGIPWRLRLMSTQLFSWLFQPLFFSNSLIRGIRGIFQYYPF